jgi:ubiquinone biosynthesis protein UbiJ
MPLEQKRHLVGTHYLWLGTLGMAAIGIVAFLVLSQKSRVIVVVNSGEMEVDPQIFVVSNPKGKLELLRTDYLKRAIPLQEEFAKAKGDLSAAKADLAGAEEKNKLLIQAIVRNENEIPAFIQESSATLETLWKEEGAKLDKEFEEFRQGLLNEIGGRAKELNLPYNDDLEIREIEVAVNAYRLSLYNTGGKLDVSKERNWAEEILKRWNVFCSDWQKRQLSVKDRAVAIKKKPQPKIDEARSRIESLQLEREQVLFEIAAFQDEVKHTNTRVEDLENRLKSLRGPFYQELLQTPELFKVGSYQLQPDGKAELTGIDKREDLTIGEFLVFVKAVSGEKVYWGMKNLEIRKNQSIELRIERDQFIPMESFLQ